MASSRGRSAAALAVGVLSALGNAQAFFGGDQSSCTADEAFVDLGCFTGSGTVLAPFIPTNYDPANPSGSYPGFDTGTNFNATVTPQTCVTTCRGYGFRTAALSNNVCSCGYGMPSLLLAGTGICNVPCSGDSSQNCGGATDTEFYVDPSFADPGELSGLTSYNISSYYEYLGCFHMNGAFPTGDLVNSVSNQATADLCFQNCASLRYPLANVVPASGGGFTCTCGETFDFGDFRVHEGDESPTGSCSTDCTSGIANTCDPTTQRCCGAGNYFPVYINPELEGCYVPTIPGYGLVNELNQPTAYICADIDPTLTSGPQVFTTTTYAGTQVTSTALPIHPVSVTGPTNGAAFNEYGCFAGTIDTVLTNLVAGVNGQITLEQCADACATYDFFGITNGDTCDCSNTVASLPVESFANCNIRCGGSATELCGGNGYVEVYAVPASWNNEVSASIASTVVATPNPAYACSTTSSGSSSSTSSSTSSSESSSSTSSSESSSSTTSSDSSSSTDTQTSTSETSTSETSTSGSSTSTTDTATITSQTITPTQPPADNAYIFQVKIVAGSVQQAQKRQVVVGDDAGFVGAAGPVNPTDCTLATPFVFENGTLSSGGEFVSTDAGVAYQPFWTTPTNGSILTTFALQGGALVWSNDAFANTMADFCRDDSGQIWVVFDGNAPPFDCTTVQLVVYQTEQCQSGTIVPPSSSMPSTSMTSTSTDSSTMTTTTDSSATTDFSSTSVSSSMWSNSTTTASNSTMTSSSTSSSSVPTAPPADGDYIFGVVPIGTDAIARRAIVSRQFAGGNGFIGGAGPVNPTDCTLATPFSFVNGQLTSGGELVSTNAGVSYQAFAVSPVVGTITTTFALQNGLLVWSNAAFVGTNADFCQDNAGQVWIVFDATAPAFACAPVNLVAFAVTQCADGTLITSATAAPTACTSGACLGNGTLTLGPGTFFNDAVAATARPVADCVVRNETWVSGQTTLLPRTA